MPDEREVAPLVSIEDLDTPWKDLLNRVLAYRQEGTLSEKQTVDILLRAWTRAFTYSKTQDTLDKYGYLVDSALATKIINLAEGNCGYAGRGFLALCKAVNIPVREIGAFLSNNGHFNEVGNYHMMIKAYINGKWVLIEPQSGYAEEGFKVESVPVELKTEFNKLLSDIPEKKHSYVFDLEHLPALPSMDGGTIKRSLIEQYRSLAVKSTAATVALGIMAKVGADLGMFVSSEEGADNPLITTTLPTPDITTTLPTADPSTFNFFFPLTEMLQALSQTGQEHLPELAVLFSLVGAASSFKVGKRLGETQVREKLRKIEDKIRMEAGKTF